MKRTVALLCLLVTVAFTFTGCAASEIWSDMMTQWDRLMDESHRLHGELIYEAVNVNSEVLDEKK